MGSFFVVQVHTGSEIEVKNRLEGVLEKTNNNSVKAIYAMETFTEIAKSNNPIEDLSNLDINDISEHLHMKRIQSSLSNLRNAYTTLKNSGENDYSLLESYQENIRSLTKQLKEIRCKTKKISSLLKGYILVELTSHVFTIPNDVWHLIKSIPRVIGFPSKNNVPKEEIDFFFQKVDMTSQVEIELNEILAIEDIEEKESELLCKANEAIGTEEEYVILDQLNNIYSNTEETINKEIQNTISSLEPNPASPMRTLLNSLKIFVQNKRQKVVMSGMLYKLLCKSDRKQNFIQSRKAFLDRLKFLFQGSFNSGEVVLE